jgi:hypothetical protein
MAAILYNWSPPQGVSTSTLLSFLTFSCHIGTFHTLFRQQPPSQRCCGSSQPLESAVTLPKSSRHVLCIYCAIIVFSYILYLSVSSPFIVKSHCHNSITHLLLAPPHLFIPFPTSYTHSFQFISLLHPPQLTLPHFPTKTTCATDPNVPLQQGGVKMP